MPIAIDLHSHTRASKKLPFKIGDYERMLARAADTGLSGFASTEHFHAIDYWDTMRDLASRFSYKDGALRVRPGFNVMTGAEIDIAEGGHILAIGPLDAIEELDGMFDPRLSTKHMIPANELITAARQVGLTLIGAHPTRKSKYLAGTGMATLARLDALELNGTDVGLGKDVQQVQRMADEIGLPTVGSSDAHTWAQIGVQRTIIEGEQLSLNSLRDALDAKQTAIETLMHVGSIVKVAKTHKSVSKKAAKSRGARMEEVVPTISRVSAVA